jgi:nickel-dependent lactate racemase
MKGRGYFNGEGLTFDLPDDWNLLAMAEPREVDAVQDIEAEVKRALDNPIGMEPLSKIVPNLENKKTVILSEDQTRPTQVGSIALPLINELNRLGIPDEDIQVVIARGTHRHPTEDEIRDKLGEEVLKRVKVSVHDADDQDNLVLVGTTSRGTPCWANRLVVEASLKIGIGTCNPHYFAGYGGGPKMVLPGISGRETVKKNHVLLGEPNSTQGIREGNPVWEDMLEAARIVGLDMKIDTVLNSQTEVYKVFAGDVEAEQEEAVEALLGIYGVTVPKMADITITSGYPLEIDLIQSGKAILLADAVTRPGGTIVLISACPDGAGPMMYETLSEKPKSEQVIEWIAEGKASTTGGPMASRLRRLLKAKTLLVVTDGLTAQQLQDMDMEHAASVEEAIRRVSARYEGPDVIVLPVGSSTFPYVEKEEALAKAA